MKLSLEHRQGISIVSVSEDVDVHHFNVLKAGINKLLADGKNKIVINLQSIPSIPSDVIREVAILDLSAKELSGRIALASVNAEVKQQIIAFAKPPVLPMFETLDGAVEFFQRTTAAVEGDDYSALKARIQQLENELNAAKQAIAAAPPEEIERIKHENKEYQEWNAKLKQEVADLMAERKRFVADGGLREQNLVLEETIKRMAEQSADAKPKAPPAK